MELHHWYVKSQLEMNVRNITFKKVNGTEHTMVGTLKPSLLPLPNHVSNPDWSREAELTKEGQTIVVWNPEINEWRSFRLANLISIEAKQ